MSDAHDHPIPREKALSRLSNVFAFGARHPRNSMFRTPSMEPAPAGNVHADRPLPPTPSVTELLTSSPPSSPRLMSNNESGLIPPPKAPTPRGSPLDPQPPRLSPLRSASGARHPLTDSSTVPLSPANPKITFDLASPDPADRPRHNSFRPRARSDASKPLGKPVLTTSTSFPGPDHVDSAISLGDDRIDGDQSHGNDGQHRPTSTFISDLRRRTSLGTRSSPKSADESHLPHPQEALGLGISRAKTEQPHDSTTSLSSAPSHHDRSAFMRFLKDLPNRLHRTSTVSPDDAVSPSREGVAGQLPPLPPKPRRKKGEVVCLHYGTIDDVGWVWVYLRHRYTS